MYEGEKTVDVHGHHSTPANFRAYAYNLIALRTPVGSGLEIPEGPMQQAQERHLGLLDERGVDVQFISPRPVAMMHWEQPALVEHWTMTTNDVIHQTCELHPDRFRGIAQLPQVGVDYATDTKGCVAEFERSVNGLGFIGALVNPDPAGDRAQMERSYAQPDRFDERKLFPGSSLEFQRPRAVDFWGFIACFAICFGIIGLAVLVSGIGT